VVWIGGVSMVTTVLLPMVRGLDASARPEMFEAIERRFRPLARIAVLVAGLSGLYMLVRLDLWDRFASPAYWWMHAMVLVWLLFALLLFVIEPRSAHRGSEAASGDKFGRMVRLHWVLLILSALTILGAVAGSHGASLSG